MNSTLRYRVWRNYHGTNYIGTCYTCGDIITYDNWQNSHVVAKSKNGTNDISNLRPCCKTCNTSMGNQNLYTYIFVNHLKGVGSYNVMKYFSQNPSAINDKRTRKNK